MDSKDESYDPCVNYHSDSEPELNNIRDAISSVGTPLEDKDIFNWDGFTLNNIHTDKTTEGRRGGSLADNDPKNSAAAVVKKQKIGTCICCETSNVGLWHGNRYKCHSGERIKEHASFCKECAAGYDEDDERMTCPRHDWRAKDRSEARLINLEEVYD